MPLGSNTRLLATAIAGPILDHVGLAMSPFEGAHLAVKLEVDPEGALDDVARDLH